jgi:hypothetical protein
MKIIFLDIDGVLNNQIMYENREDVIGGKGKISKKCLEILNGLIADTGAKIVISSAWRSDDDIEDYLYGIGLKGEIIGKTPRLGKYSLRGNEIYAWLMENDSLFGKPYHDFHSFVILDDDSDMLLWHRENFFHTDSYSGLTPNIAYKAKRFLNR